MTSDILCFYVWVSLMLDYDEKAEDAVDYEDFDEQYEGPEIQATSEEDHLLPKKEYFSTDVSLASLKPTSVFDDENYDEELEQEHEVVDNNLEVQTTSLTGVVSIIFTAQFPLHSLYRCIHIHIHTHTQTCTLLLCRGNNFTWYHLLNLQL